MGFDINNVILVGRLTRDPEFSYTPTNNTPLCKFSIANNNGRSDDQNSVSYFDIVTWNKMGEICNQYLKKGSQVVINGRIQQRRYQDSQGQNRSKIDIVANNVQFIGGRSDPSSSMDHDMQGQNQPPSYGTEPPAQPNRSTAKPSAPEKTGDPFDNIDFSNPGDEEIPF